MIHFALLLVAFPAFALPVPLQGQSPAAAEEAELSRSLGQGVVRKTGPHSYEIGEVQVDAAAREIRFPAKVNMNQGLVEVVICTEHGKLHESLFVTQIQPIHLHVALLLLGLKAGSNPGWHLAEDPLFRPPGWERPRGDQMEVYVRWQGAHGQHESRAEALLVDQRTGRPLPRTSWVFIGSHVDVKGIYAADEIGSIVTNYHDWTAVVDNPLQGGQLDDFTFANTELLPEIATPVEIRIVPAKKPKKGTEK